MAEPAAGTKANIEADPWTPEAGCGQGPIWQHGRRMTAADSQGSSDGRPCTPSTQATGLRTIAADNSSRRPLFVGRTALTTDTGFLEVPGGRGHVGSLTTERPFPCRCAERARRARPRPAGSIDGKRAAFDAYLSLATTALRLPRRMGM